MVPEIIIALIYISLSALFSASEVSLFSIPREDVAGLGKGNSRERKVFSLLEKGEETLIVILLGNIFVNLMVVGLVEKLVKAVVGNSVVLFVLGSTGVLLVFGEIIPKAVALKLGRKVIETTAPFLLLVRMVLYPLIVVFKKLNRSLLRWNYFFILSSPYPFITSNEYRFALERASQNGDINPDAASFITAMGEISEYPLSRIVVHRTFVEETDVGYSVSLTEEGTVLAVTDVVAEERHEEFDWLSVTKTLGDLIRLIKKTGRRFALVHDEYGEYYGIATAESLHSYLKNIYSPDTQTERSIELDGSEPIAKYLQWFDEEMLDRFPEIQSVGGILVAWFETIPSKGSVFESESYIFEVLQAEQNSVSKLRITRKNDGWNRN